MGNKYEKLIDPTEYQVFIMACPANIPFNFASHTWFVCNEKGNVSRWEVLFNSNKDKGWGHLHVDHFPPFSGIAIFPFTEKWLWKGEVLGKIEGGTAENMIRLIKGSKDKYLHIHDYSLIGNNSNTYARWIISFYPEIEIKLPWNSFGK